MAVNRTRDARWRWWTRAELSCVLVAVILALCASPCQGTLIWDSWSTYGPCSAVECEVQPIQTRNRTCVDAAVPDIANGCAGNSTEQQPCGNITLCSGVWEAWSPWTNCVNICNTGGEEKRFRECRPRNSSVQDASVVECRSGGPYVETRSCPAPTQSIPSSPKLQIIQLPANVHVGGVGVLICCILPSGLISRFSQDSQASLQNRTGLRLLNTVGRLDAEFTSLVSADSGQYACVAEQQTVDVISVILTVNPRPAPPTSMSTTTMAPTTVPATVPTTAPAATTTQGRTQGPNAGNDDEEKKSDVPWLAIFIPVGLVFVIIITVVTVVVVVWRFKYHNQVLVARRAISGEDGVQKIEAINAKRISVSTSLSKKEMLSLGPTSSAAHSVSSDSFMELPGAQAI